jgi:hypothetical protein
MNAIEEYFDWYDEPIRSTLLFLRRLILTSSDAVTEKWLYGMPFYYYRGHRFCYLWVHKKYAQPYLGIVDGEMIDHPDLLKEHRTRMKILLVDPAKDIPGKKIEKILRVIMTKYT